MGEWANVWDGGHVHGEVNVCVGDWEDGWVFRWREGWMDGELGG